MPQKKLIVPIPLEVISPEAWDATWNEEVGLRYAETFSPQALEANPRLVQQTLAAIKNFGLDTVTHKLTDTSTGMSLVISDPDAGLIGLAAELIMQLEIRDRLAPGVFQEILRLLYQPRIPPTLQATGSLPALPDV